MLKFYTRHGRFPRGRAEFSDEVVEFVARQVKVSGAEFGLYEWAGRTIERHRGQIRAHLGFRECSVADADKFTVWLTTDIAHAEENWFLTVWERVPDAVRGRVLALVGEEAEMAAAPGDEEDGDEESVLALVKSLPGNVSLESMLREIRKLRAIRAVGLPAGLFADTAPKVLAGWRQQAVVESPSHLRRRSPQSRLTLLAALLVERKREVTGKENILFQIAEASLARPDEEVSQVVFPAVRGGEQTLRELVHEFKTKGPVYRRTVQTTLRVSYTNHYRRGLIALLEVLEFRSGNNAHQPVIDALALIKRYARAGNTTYYPLGEQVPEHRGTTGQWAEVVFKEDTRGQRRVVRVVFEVVTFQALREQLRCKEIWVASAGRWRDPDEDLPRDFEARRAEHYGELRKPLNPREFVDQLREAMTAELMVLDEEIGGLDWVDITERKMGAIRFTAPGPQEEPRNLRKVKAEVGRRWQAVPLIDILKEAILRTGCLHKVAALSGGTLDAQVLAERLMLAIYAYGTNTGIRQVIGVGSGHSEEEVRYARRRYLTLDAARLIATEIANATFAARDAGLWGQSSTAVASDSTHFRSWDQNLFTEWHSRYGGRGSWSTGTWSGARSWCTARR